MRGRLVVGPSSACEVDEEEEEDDDDDDDLPLPLPLPLLLAPAPADAVTPLLLPPLPLLLPPLLLPAEWAPDDCLPAAAAVTQESSSR